MQGLGPLLRKLWGVKLGFWALFSPWDQGFQAQTLVPQGMALGGREPEWKEVGCGPEQGLGRVLWSPQLPGEVPPAEGWVPRRFSPDPGLRGGRWGSSHRVAEQWQGSGLCWGPSEELGLRVFMGG